MNNEDLNESLSEVEAVMRLLEEKERDLELAARIGQTLLADNRKLKVFDFNSLIARMLRLIVKKFGR